MRVIDSHVHVWDLSGGGYAWLGPQHGPLHRDFTIEEARRELLASGIDGAVLVQAEDSEQDTRAMLAAADVEPLVVGVVGWVRLDDPAEADRELDDYGRHPQFRGVRHLVHDDPRDDFLDLPNVRRSLALLAGRGLVLDVPDAWPRHLPGLAHLAEDLPDLTVVVDHLGKPPRGTDEIEEWERALRAIARYPNTVAKLSGLQRPGQPLTAAALRPVWDVALEAFGPGRLMYGGDWPMTIPYGGYAEHWSVVTTLAGELTRSERELLLAGTAAQTYGLEMRTGP